jgi:hypothetical protein
MPVKGSAHHGLVWSAVEVHVRVIERLNLGGHFDLGPGAYPTS